ncbi:hypothetical protein GYMLUDRAFT_39487 [Collybiopsis luxurians FD-317 M1]|nr:hypothetical protein GYMLUDRAFT_39487 [Collybiopsis luxurians FD-317 M1]
MSSPVPITGCINSGTHPRLAIEDLKNQEPDQFILFILSYLLIQDRPQKIEPVRSQSKIIQIAFDAVYSSMQSDKNKALSFLELGGIHGLPYKGWEGDPQSPRETDYNPKNLRDMRALPSRFGGFCNHGSVLFPSWHRPYVMAIEQSIGDVAHRLANEIEKQKYEEFEPGRWTTAADKLRFPWWDWAEKKVAKEGLPLILSEDRMQLALFTDDGRGRTERAMYVENPLSYYPFKSKLPDGFKDDTETDPPSYFGTWMRTVRYGPTERNKPPVSDTRTLNATLLKNAECIRHRVATLFSLSLPDEQHPGDRIYDEFSNHTTQSNTKADYYVGESLEGVHDSMHNILGQNGHMGDPDYAGFDPIFYLHHCNVDRLYALWEYVYPKDCYIEGGDHIVHPHSNDPYAKGGYYVYTQSSGTYSLVYNEGIDPKTALFPFRTKKGEYWTSDEARGLDENSYPKYYTYPPVDTVNGQIDVGKSVSSEQQREKYRVGLQKYYGLGDSIANVPLEQISPLVLSAESTALGRKLYTLPDAARVVISVQTPEFAFDGPYSIEVHYTDKKNEPQYVGSISVFARQPDSNCANCKKKRQLGTTIHGLIVVPPSVVHDVRDIVEDSSSALPTTIADELKKRLHATILDRFHKEIATAKGGSADNGQPGEFTLGQSISPRITLASSYVAHPEKHDNGKHESPLIWHGWTSHGDIFEPSLETSKWSLVQGN